MMPRRKEAHRLPLAVVLDLGVFVVVLVVVLAVLYVWAIGLAVIALYRTVRRRYASRQNIRRGR